MLNVDYFIMTALLCSASLHSFLTPNKVIQCPPLIKAEWVAGELSPVHEHRQRGKQSALD